MSLNIPTDIWTALIGLISAIFGWLVRGHHNGKKDKPFPNGGNNDSKTK